MMTFGVTGAFGFSDIPQPQVLAHYAAAGCRVLQVYRNRQHEVPAAEVLRIVRDLPLRVDSIHGHFGDDLDPSNPDPAVRRYAIETYTREAEYCRQLGGDLVVVHPCPAVDVSGPRLDACFAALRQSMDELARVGERIGVRFAFENLPGTYAVGAAVSRLVDSVVATASRHIVFLLDTGHAHMTVGVESAIRTAGAALSYTHVHDNDGRNDLHQLPTRGSIDWTALGWALHEVRYAGVFLLEVFEPAEQLATLLTPAWIARMQAIVGGTV